jgi:hypothetical protein
MHFSQKWQVCPIAMSIQHKNAPLVPQDKNVPSYAAKSRGEYEETVLRGSGEAGFEETATEIRVTKVGPRGGVYGDGDD